MTIEELERELIEHKELQNRVKRELEALELALEEFKKSKDDPKPPHPRWKPEKGGTYYDIYFGSASRSDWDGYVDDDNDFAIGNVFKTEAEAEFAIERLKVLAEMSEWAGKWDDPFRVCYTMSDTVGVARTNCDGLAFGEMRFATLEDANNCIKAVGEDRIKKYYIGVPDEDI